MLPNLFRKLRRIGPIHAGLTALRNAGLVTPRQEGPRGVARYGHRDYVGGAWDQMGKLQFDFLVARGLKPQDVFLDVACGAFRGGVFFIRYLDRGNYLGIEKEELLITEGIAKELGPELVEEKAPEIVISGAFEFQKLSKTPSFALAQSLFTHLCSADIELCLGNLRAFVRPGCRLYASFFETHAVRTNYKTSHAHVSFFYTRRQMERLGEEHGWRAAYIGGWRHPAGQVMMEFVAI